MPAPVYSAGTVGNVINGVSVAHGATVSAFLDLSAAIEGQVNCEVTTGAGAPTAGTTFSAYRAYAAGALPPITLSAGAAAGATSISVTSSTGLHQGQSIALQQLGGSKLGEVVSITGAITGTGPYTVPVSATINAYLNSDAVYLIGQSAVFSVTPSSTAGTWAANKDYSSPMYLGTGQYVIAANNTDASQSVTVSATVDKVTSYA
jgi:hypothetical protein